jgi:hypothetical protein
MLISVYINGILYYFPNEISILEACRSIGIKIPRFCYHENLSIAGNCRMCLVEINEIAKPIVACSSEIFENMIIYTESPMVLKSRENVLEFLLLNHPLDCPICDQAGECDLQDQAIFFGSNLGRNYFNKRSVEDKNINHIIKTIMTRCIHCTKCIRFGEEICGIKFFGTLNRGTNTEIGNYIIKLSLSEISANVIDLCPVGALTLKTNPFQIRPWEIQLIESIDLSDSLGSNIYLSYRGLDLFRIVPKKNKYINESWITNKTRFYFELMPKFVSTSSILTNIFVDSINNSVLFLFNSDLDLKTLYFLKNISRKNVKISSKLLSSTNYKTNFYFWNNKLSINSLNNNKNYTFFLISTNLQTEVPLFNIRVKSKIKQGFKAFALSCSFISNFPIEFIKFSIIDILHFIKGTHSLLSKFLYITECIIFANKSIYDRLDISFFHILSNKSIKYYLISNFCNTESVNILNFKKFNFKEFKYSAQIFGLGLDDTYLIRKLLPIFSQFYWVNQLPANILSLLSPKAWIKLEINQTPGLYLNLEQRVQKFSLIQQEYKLSILNFINFISSYFNFKKNYNLNKLFANFNFNNNIWILNELKESNKYIYLFDTKILYFSFFKKNLNFSSFGTFKLLPLKFIFEDPYRTSLQLKYSRTLTKSSQLLRIESLYN